MAIVEKRALILWGACVLNSALKRFLKRFHPTERDRSSEKIFVAAFGKHPGWDDHIGDIGLDTDVLITAKRTLYVQGIGGNVDSGRWDRLTSDQRIEEFNRVIFWYMDGYLIVGRMWSSQDGKGRKSYPFVVCVQCRKLPMRWILDNVLPQLEKIERTCTSTNSANDVRMSIQSSRQELRQLARQCKNPPDSMAVYPDALAKLVERPEMGPDRAGLFRVLYHIDREVGLLRPGTTKGKASGSTLLRLPACSNSTSDAALLWSSFLLTTFGVTMPILALVPPAKDWIDVIMGRPTELQLYCLRASPKVIPLTSNIPYNVGPEFIGHADGLVRASQRRQVSRRK